MRVQNVSALVAPILFLACGGSPPTAPTATNTPPAVISTALDLVPGAYTLTIAMSRSGEPTCNNGICVSVSLCGGSSSAPGSGTASTAVRLDRQEDVATIRPQEAAESFRMELRQAGTGLYGTAVGAFRDGTTQTVVVAGSGQSAAGVSGSLLAASASGRIDGQVSIGGYGCSNNGHSWTLVPR